MSQDKDSGPYTSQWLLSDVSRGKCHWYSYQELRFIQHFKSSLSPVKAGHKGESLLGGSTCYRMYDESEPPLHPFTRAPCMRIWEAGPGQQRQPHSRQDCQGQDVNITKGTAVKMVLTNCFSSNRKAEPSYCLWQGWEAVLFLSGTLDGKKKFFFFVMCI